MEIVTSPSVIIPEVLKEDNYERWSILMQQYLELQDLWEVIQSYKMPTGGNKEQWSKKNALALYAIRISCGTEAFDLIKKTPHAKTAWDVLAVKLKPPPIVEVVTHDIFEQHQERQTEHQKALQKLISSKPISALKHYLRDQPDAKSAPTLDFALKHAITCGRKNMARYIYGEIPLDFLKRDRGFSLLEHCITKRMFDIALDLLGQFPKLASNHPLNSTPIILTLAGTPPPFLSLSELGSWGRWIYKSTRAKAFPIKPRSAPARGFGIVQDKLRKWILPALYKYHLVCVIVGLLCWLPCWLAVRVKELDVKFAVFLFFVVPLLKLDLLCVLIGVPLLTLVPPHKPVLSLILFSVFILLLVIQRLILRKGDKDLFRIPIGVPLLLLGVAILLSVGIRAPAPLRRLSVVFFALVLLFSMPLLVFVIQQYKLKLMDEYALEVIHSICRSLSNLDENQFVQSGAVEATFQAIKNGIPEIVIELMTESNNEHQKANANILWSRADSEDSINLFACAVAHRQEKVARFLYDKFGARKDTNMVTATDEDGNNILHVAAQLAPHTQLDHISGAALQLQSEIHWFKSVEGIVPRFCNEKNRDGETPTRVFLREHGNLLKEAERWMKKVAQSCSVVGALVITIMFAAAFTVPGGNNQEIGFPILLLGNTNPPTGSPTFLNKNHNYNVSFSALFELFAVSDAISLFAASSSVLMFLGILTSRYACQDFHISLPIKLMIGLSSLFISIAAMMVAFCATLFIMLHAEKPMSVAMTSIASIPVTLFILLQFPLLIEIYDSTFRTDIFYRRRYWKYGKNVCSCFNRRWWLKMRRGWMVMMLCALFALYLISFYLFVV